MKKFTSFIAISILLFTASFTQAQTLVTSVYDVPFGETVNLSKYKIMKKGDRYFASNVTESFIDEVEYTLSPNNIVTQVVVRFIETSHDKAIEQHKQITDAMLKKYQGEIENKKDIGFVTNLLTENADITILRGFTNTHSNVAILYRLHDMNSFVHNKL